MGVASEGMTRRAPAVVAESSSTTWKNSGSVKRYCEVVSPLQRAMSCKRNGTYPVCSHARANVDNLRSDGEPSAEQPQGNHRNGRRPCLDEYEQSE